MPLPVRYAVIDLGTNTFHLMIVEEQPDGVLRTVYRHRMFVRLAEQGIQRIGAAAFQRGLEALANFKEAIDAFQVRKVIAYGTAALRTAENAQHFLDTVAERIGIQGKVITGLEEALLIYKGVRQAIPHFPERAVIMDVGGGSVEFVIVVQGVVVWEQSFPIGVAVLYRKFHHERPLSPSEKEQLQTFLTEHLTELRTQLSAHRINTLIGASGAFDILELHLQPVRPHPTYVHYTLAQFWDIYHRILPTTLAERRANPLIPEERAEMIVVALVLIGHILALHTFTDLFVSDYDLKEGMLLEVQE